MKITLNDSVAVTLRPEVEKLVQQLVPGAEISWLPSRFPRVVMLVEPGGTPSDRPKDGAFFGTDAATSHVVMPGKITALLEERITQLIGGSSRGKK
jgi:hypothetical protein